MTKRDDACGTPRPLRFRVVARLACSVDDSLRRAYGRLVARALSVCVVLGWAAWASAGEPWKTYAVRDGVTYEKRAVADSKFLEYRASGVVDRDVPTLLAGIWRAITETLPPAITRRTVLSRSDTELVVHDEIRTPVVSDRDVVIRMRKVATADGAQEIRFEALDGVGPPPDRKHVRVRVVRGKWRVEPAPGGTRVTYLCYSEPGGSIPAFLVRGAQQDQVIHDVERVLGDVRRRSGR